MNSVIIGLISFVCIFGGAMLGLYLRKILPGHHLSEESKDTVKTGVAIVATLTALVLGLLISSAKSSLDEMNTTLTESGANIIMLDRVLSYYGPEAKEIRGQLRDVLQSLIQRIWSRDKIKKIDAQFTQRGQGMELVLDKIRLLTPQNESQRLLQAQALQIGNNLLQSRWLVLERAQLTIPTIFLVILLFWLTILFASIGLFSPYNSTVVIVLMVCAISVACAIFLIEDLSRPYQGMMKVSSAPFDKALEHLGR